MSVRIRSRQQTDTPQARSEYSPFNAVGLPLDKDYQEYIQYAGKSGMVAQYSEDTGTIKLIFTSTPTLHMIGGRARYLEDNGIGKVGIVLQTPEQLKQIARKINDFATMMEWMQDPEFEFKDEFMGRKCFDENEVAKQTIKEAAKEAAND